MPEKAVSAQLKTAALLSPKRPYSVDSKADDGEGLPELGIPARPMELFDPEKHQCRPSGSHVSPSFAALTPLCAAARLNPDLLLIPREEDCFTLWDRYRMMDHIRTHCTRVAEFARAVTERAAEQGCPTPPEAAYAAGLLHDIAKSYTISHGGSHAQLGASWVMRETRNGPISRSVLFHVHWPWEENVDDDLQFLVLAIVYADKRVRHDTYVSLEERYEDLLDRYGVNDRAKWYIGRSHEQGKRIEAALSRRLGVNLHECTLDSGRLVQRT